MSCEGEWELMQKRCENSAAPPRGGGKTASGGRDGA